MKQYEEFTSPPEFVPGLDSFGLDSTKTPFSSPSSSPILNVLFSLLAFETEVKLEPYDYTLSSPELVPNSTAKAKGKAAKPSGAAKSRQANSSASASADSPETAESEKTQKATDRR